MPNWSLPLQELLLPACGPLQRVFKAQYCLSAVAALHHQSTMWLADVCNSVEKLQRPLHQGQQQRHASGPRRAAQGGCVLLGPQSWRLTKAVRVLCAA